MKELVTIEKGRYQALLNREQDLSKTNRLLQELHLAFADLQKRYFELLTTKKLATDLVSLGDYVKSVDTNV
jgi:hypothetical protein